ncbi:HNH/ENDO VII family nuclease [Bacillus sp. JJ722]|uniref:HNH/ENDO VII family nuclease n=1 Tax=Bacillus sp. JJ722 TaxID=3122973 RepID=UPI0030008959
MITSTFKEIASVVEKEVNEIPTIQNTEDKINSYVEADKPLFEQKWDNSEGDDVTKEKGTFAPETNVMEPLKVSDVDITDETFGFEKYTSLETALEKATEAEKQVYDKANVEAGEVNSRDVLKRTDIDYDAKDAFGKTNLDRMEQGKAPLIDGKPVELHHIGQEMDSPLAELTQTEHRGPGNDAVLHDKQKETEIDRNKFNAEREDHWKARAEQCKLERGDLDV